MKDFFLSTSIFKPSLKTFSIFYVPCFFLILLLFSCVHSIPSKEIHLPNHTLLTFNFSDEKLKVIENTFEQFRSLRPTSLKIPTKIYTRLSRFESLFGFPFNGELLSNWVIKRARSITYRNTWTVAINQNKGQFVIGDPFFEGLSDLERLYLLVHEARHSDGNGYKHVKCPENFPGVSSAQPKMNLSGSFACDNTADGAYAYHSAFLFELYAYALFDQKEVGLLYNSSITRILK